MEQDKIIVITGPSGAGKSKARDYALERYNQLAFSISANSRERRPHEKDGIDYHFMPGASAAERAAKFREKVNNNQFLEWQQVYNNNNGYRGTLVTEIPRIWGEGKIPLLDLDVEGAINVKLNLYPKQTTCIFIEPVSLEVLVRILRQRSIIDGADPKKIEDRIRKAPLEIARAKEVGKRVFEYTLINKYNPASLNLIDNYFAEILGVEAPF